MSGRRLGAACATLALLTGLQLAGASAASLSVSSQRLATYRTCTLTALTGGAPTGRDATVRQGSPGGNFGSVTPNHVASGSGTNRRLYVQFDLSSCRPSLPASAVVHLATLRLYLLSLPADCRTVDIFPVQAPWVETTITWANQPFGTTINQPPSSSRSGAFTVGAPGGCQNHVVSRYVSGATVTDDVAAAIGAASTIVSWMLRDDAEGSTTTRTIAFAAREAGVTERAPQLVVTYAGTP